jgi:hypothetical protein
MVKDMQITLTAVFEKVKNGYIGYVEELPGAKTWISSNRKNIWTPLIFP